MRRYNYNLQSVDIILDKYNGKKPGVAAIAIEKGDIIYENTVGLSNLEYSISISPNTVFNLASISKPITAIAIIILKEKGLINYSDNIIDYFPELSHYCSGVTIKHLLTHSSGIINYYRILDKLNKSELHITNDDIYKLLCNENSLLFNPGDEFDYSNSNYVLLAMLIEKVSKKTFSEFLNNNIFRPLNMNGSLVFNENQPIVANRAYGYDFRNDKYICDYTGAFTTGDGCVFSSISDLAILINSLYNNELISKESLNEAFTSSKSNSNEDLGYSFGWETHRSTKELKRLHHSGSDAGFRGLITTFPNFELTVILLSNNSQFSFQDRLDITNEFVKTIILQKK